MTGEKLVCYDLETGGLSLDHPIVQIGAVAVDEDLREMEHFECKILFDEADSHPEALKKNSYDRTLWREHGITPRTAADRFARFLRKHATLGMVSQRSGRSYHVARLMAHNASFDAPRMQRFFRSLDVFLPAHPRVLCTLQRAYWLFEEHKTLTPPPDYTLETLCRYFEIPFHCDDAHEPLYDVRKTIAVCKAMRDIRIRELPDGLVVSLTNGGAETAAIEVP